MIKPVITDAVKNSAARWLRAIKEMECELSKDPRRPATFIIRWIPSGKSGILQISVANPIVDVG